MFFYDTGRMREKKHVSIQRRGRMKIPAQEGTPRLKVCLKQVHLEGGAFQLIRRT